MVLRYSKFLKQKVAIFWIVGKLTLDIIYDIWNYLRHSQSLRHLELSLTILIFFETFKIFERFNTFDAFEILLRHLKFFWDIWNHFEIFEIILRYLKLFRDIWNYFETFEIILRHSKYVYQREKLLIQGVQGINIANIASTVQLQFTGCQGIGI